MFKLHHQLLFEVIEVFHRPDFFAFCFLTPMLFFIQSLELASEGTIQTFQMNPATHPYDELLESEDKEQGEKGRVFPGLKPQAWDKVYPDLALVASIPNSLLGEKMIHDLLVSSIERMGVFQLGRVEMYMFCSKEAIKVTELLRA